MNSSFKIVIDSKTGYQIWESKTHNLQIQYSDIGSGNYYEALEYVSIYNDWRVPSLEELKILYHELHTLGFGNFRLPENLKMEFMYLLRITILVCIGLAFISRKLNLQDVLIFLQDIRI
jgi:hypothetical protein